MAKPTQKDHALVSYWVSKSGQSLNRYAAVWAAQALRQDYNDDTLREAIDWFVAHDQWPTWDRFKYKVDQVIDKQHRAKLDRIRREKMRQRTKELILQDESRSSTD